MQLIYKGVDIYSQIQLKECIYESYCCNHFNYLRVLFEDGTHIFDSFGMAANDEINISDGGIYTGTMYVNRIIPVSGGYEIIAGSTKAGEWELCGNKTWNKVCFKQIMQEVAGRHSMQCEFYGVEDVTYDEINQVNEPDFSFAGRIAVLEGCVIVVFDGRMIISSEKYLESQSVNSALDIDSGEVSISKNMLYSSCTVTDGNISGSYWISEGTIPIKKRFDKLDSKAMAERFAGNILRHRNKNAYAGTVSPGSLTDSYSAGSVANIISSDYMTANGKAMIYRIRHDMVLGKSKIWFRKCLEGY